MKQYPPYSPEKMELAQRIEDRAKELALAAYNEEWGLLFCEPVTELPYRYWTVKGSQWIRKALEERSNG